ncbi:Chitobiosyldiphosphodolichol beta-mannosyltransferase [Strongyloides ratti]|uniref:Beta-1,4-mannosyltransferase n=1 Tax=Strongyloides ratti TaxID=34506 RepID=A0A090LB66_STRRB|nr:Chitobiosyldiphosphodolichol beta-mannosyltransferase [Strongyloides ratti]CEF64730.1 Chitobiosyldiphosphodolichol beta-mannosyltransferase [Strongyloides ratti]
MVEEATIVVLGDIGHSPRMCYHALSLADHGVNVQIVSYLNSKPPLRIAEHDKIEFVKIPPPPDFITTKVPSLLSLIFKFMWTGIVLLFTLIFYTSLWTTFILIQNPPGLPVMAVCYLVAKLKGAYFIIDWHNYTWSILDNKYSYNNKNIKKESINNENKNIKETKSCNRCILKLIKGTMWYEGFFGRRAHFNLCVSKAMKKDLMDRWNVDAEVLYDKAPSWNFKRLMSNERCKFLNDLSYKNDFKLFLDSNGKSKFIEGNDDNLVMRNDRPVLLVSSTSWTEDEDFSILLNALHIYDNDNNNLPNIICVITGKGPMKEYYLKEIEKINLKKVLFITPWLEASDYPKLLGCADIGVSLHTSTSGIDLPMKVVDMFGCKTPVLAKNFNAITELVKDGYNGYLFNNYDELKQRLTLLLTGFPTSSTGLNELHFNLLNENSLTWENNWNTLFWPIIEGISKRRFDKEVEEMGLDKESDNKKDK